MSAAKTFHDLLGAVSPPAAAATAVAVKPSHPQAMQILKARVLPAGVGAGVGYYAWKKHHWLGAFMGAAVGDNAYRLWRGVGDDRKGALGDLVAAGAAVGGSLYMKKRPVVGFLGGAALGAVVSSFVPGSTANAIKARW